MIRTLRAAFHRRLGRRAKHLAGTRVVPEAGLLGLVSRDLFVVEGPPHGADLAAPAPRPGTQRP